jgi:hypothetical protein
MHVHTAGVGTGMATLLVQTRLLLALYLLNDVEISELHKYCKCSNIGMPECKTVCHSSVFFNVSQRHQSSIGIPASGSVR